MACDNPLPIPVTDIPILGYALSHDILKNPHKESLTTTLKATDLNIEKLIRLIGLLSPNGLPNPLVEVFTPLKTAMESSRTALTGFQTEINTLLSPQNLMSSIGLLSLYESASCVLGKENVDAVTGLGVLNQVGGNAINNVLNAHGRTSVLLDKLTSPDLVSAIASTSYPFDENDLRSLVPNYKADLENSKNILTAATLGMDNVRSTGEALRARALNFAIQYSIANFFKDIVQNQKGAFPTSLKENVITPDFINVVKANTPKLPGT
jgi:hypothetical protein